MIIPKPPPVDGSHWYTQSGQPMYEVERADGNGLRQTTLADARKMDLLPSVTTILRVLHKQGLEDWKIEQACLAVLTAPRLDGESLDAFVYRVLQVERHQDQEGQKARDLGTAIHDAMENLFRSHPIDPELEAWVRPAFEECAKLGELVCTERPLAGHGYAGKIDLVQRRGLRWMLTDFKTGKKVAKEPYKEHKLQLAAYAKMWCDALPDPQPIEVQNVYISTTEKGRFAILEHDDWRPTYYRGFLPLLTHWSWDVNYELKHD